MTELISVAFQSERAVSPLDGSELWVVLDPGLVMHREASDFLRALHGAGRSPHTIRVYAGRVASFLGWCAGQGVEWSSVSLAALARFKHFVEATPGRGGRLRSGATVNATLTAVCEFLRFCARTGLIEAAVAERLSEPRWLRFTPPGFDTGESGQFRTVRARALKARAQVSFPEALTSEQAGAVLACCRRPREHFMVILLLDTGLRIGEALGLRRADMHLLPDSRALGCAVVGAHVHVRHRANPNGALAKSRFPRTVPASDAVLSSYAGYQHERAEIAGEDDCDMVFVNLYREPLGAPMTYRAAKRLFERLARDCGFAVRPHMFRHTAATGWVRAGTDLDVVRALLGHYVGDLCQVDHGVVRYRRAAAAGERLSSWPISAQVWPWSRAA
ncbi:MAG TPA: tyrosine-type recombinase/integrase [Candidatus Dormibacteraeota bacterium]|nr:tyrosine-type recombinase/integrase [Candidatus Dormibacteraeota bacterium]